eukprot:m.152402 g.152402  ORF g.152402 m.152402 type:complete len:378 (+) comp14260_c0_seq8:74-1207(+)
MAASLYGELLEAIQQSQMRGLVNTTEWASDLLACLPSPEALPPLSFQAQTPPKELATFLLARSFFDKREFQRCAHALKDMESDVCVFLKFYATFLGAERDATTSAMSTSTADATPRNKQLLELRRALQARKEKQGLDPYCSYLLGIVLRDLKLKTDAKAYLIESVRGAPLLWAAWHELASLCTGKRDVDQLFAQDLPEHWVLKHFRAYISLELQLNKEALTIYRDLEATFPESTFILAQIGLAYNNMRDLERTQETFEALAVVDPYRLNHVDVYSNVLYVLDKTAELSHLAHHVCKVDAYRPESCCVVGMLNLFQFATMSIAIMIVLSHLIFIHAVRYIAAHALNGLHSCCVRVTQWQALMWVKVKALDNNCKLFHV